MKKLILTILLCFLCCNITFAQGLNYDEQKVLEIYYNTKKSVDTNFNNRIYTVSVKDDLKLLLHGFDEGYYDNIPNYDADFNDIVYKSIIVYFATIKESIDTEYPFYKDDTFYYRDEDFGWMVKEYLKNGSAVRLIHDIDRIALMYFRNGYFDDYRVVDIFSEYLFAIRLSTNTMTETTERMLFGVSKRNNDKPNAVVNAKTFGELLYKNPNYYKKFEK